MRNRTSWIVAAVAALLSLPASAIDYSEAISGDLPDAFFAPENAPNRYTLDVGQNLITGQASWHFDEGSDLDAFYFRVPNAFLLTAVTVETKLAGGSGTLDQTGWNLLSRSATGAIFSVNEFVPAGAPPRDLFAANLPRGAGSSEVHLNGFAGSLSTGTFRDVDYRLTLTVSPVPESSSVILLCAGVAITLTGLRRRARLQRFRS